MTKAVVVIGLALLLCTGCVSTPTGPTVSVMPGPEKSFEQFQTDDLVCRQWAVQQAGGPPQSALTQGTATGAALGTVVGAGLGALIGAAVGQPGGGAAIGAGGGLLGGTAVGASTGQSATLSAQRRYDRAYEQCMYAKGNDTPREPTAAPPSRIR
jgi:uncharacterized protein YcfJ